ncbi:DUF4123 domain-containing protein [Inquilinus limosus]|uniref:DUF4123 domain-containing protein n=1 Tax=Inquilinus limosus TaxID=171674 RepID=UPI00040F5187|nr:DUF4123 domain-containing protein [Inquilinus limosus]
MAAPSLDQPRPEEVARSLTATLDARPGPLFAVLDGGLFDDLPGDLMRQGIACRSLFLDHADKEVERAGPWLVALADERVRAHVVDLAAARPCAVFWRWPAGDMALWRHLRTINEVLIPVESGPEAGSDPPMERVLFRHWDPNVLASVLPLLDPAQFARVLGHACAVVMHAPDYGGLKEAPRSADLPPPPRGPLRLSAVQMMELQDAMVHASRLRIARFLKGQMPSEAVGITDEYLWRATLASEKSAAELNIRTEQGRARWTYLMVLSGGQAAALPEVRGFIGSGEAGPDAQVKALIQHTADALRVYDGAGGRTA